MSGYKRRIIDDELDELLPQLPAIAIEGPKGVGKTETAKQRAATVLKLDDPAEASLLDADPQRLEREPTPILIDEWQRFPRSWDLVRRSVDENRTGGRFLLTGSATPTTPPTHSGAARIVRLRLRPLSLAERGLIDRPTVSLRDFLGGAKPAISGTATMELAHYAEEILASGFPAIRGFAGRARMLQLDSYLARIVDSDMDEAGVKVRRPALLKGLRGSIVNVNFLQLHSRCRHTWRRRQASQSDNNRLSRSVDSAVALGPCTRLDPRGQSSDPPRPSPETPPS
jgi:uncharacterized protein